MRILFVLFLLTPLSFVSAATDLAPILDSQTITVIRVDLNHLDVPKIMAFLNEECKEIIPQLEPNKAVAGQILLAAQGGITYAAATVQSVVTSLLNNGKANEFFLILDKKAIDERVYPFFIAVPATMNKPKAEVDAIRKLLLQNQCPVTFHRYGFVVGIPAVPGYADKDEISDFVRTRFAGPSREKRPEFAEALDSTSGAMIQFVVGDWSVFDQEMENFSEEIPEGMPPEIKTNWELSRKVQKLLWKKMKFFKGTLDINKPEFKVEIWMNDEVAARELYGALEEIRKLFSRFMASEEDHLFLAYWYLDVFNKALTTRESGKSITVSIDATKYKALKKELIQTILYLERNRGVPAKRTVI